jgi:hypothetical protein
MNILRRPPVPEQHNIKNARGACSAQSPADQEIRHV